MRIVDNRTPAGVPFNEVKKGEVFYHPEFLCFLIKCEEVGCDECSGMTNAVSLDQGSTYGIEDTELVELVDARIEIRSRR